jgi:hypothetical protein
MPQYMADFQGTMFDSSGNNLFKFDVNYWKKLFKKDDDPSTLVLNIKHNDHPSITIVSNIKEANEHMLVGKTIIIVVDTDSNTMTPTMDMVRDKNGLWKACDGSKYEVRVIMGIYCNPNPKSGQV